MRKRLALLVGSLKPKSKNRLVNWDSGSFPVCFFVFKEY